MSAASLHSDVLADSTSNYTVYVVDQENFSDNLNDTLQIGKRRALICANRVRDGMDTHLRAEQSSRVRRLVTDCLPCGSQPLREFCLELTAREMPSRKTRIRDPYPRGALMQSDLLPRDDFSPHSGCLP